MDGVEGVLEVVVTGWHRLGGGEEKGGRGCEGFGDGFGFGWRGVEWNGVK